MSDAVFTMTYTDGGVSRDYVLAAERLWEVIERADAKFCSPPGPEDHQRFERALKIATGKR